MPAHRAPSICHLDKQQRGSDGLCLSCYRKRWRARNKDKIKIHVLNRIQKYHEYRSLGVPAYRACSTSYQSYVKKLAWMRTYAKAHILEARIRNKRWREKAKNLYGGNTGVNPAARMKQDYLKGVVDLGTKEVS